MKRVVDELKVDRPPLFGQLGDSLLISALRRVVAKNLGTMSATDIALLVLLTLEESFARSKLSTRAHQNVTILFQPGRYKVSPGTG